MTARGFEAPSVEAAQCFRRILEAMARPGVVRRIGGALPPAPMSAAAGAVALTLCDPETPIWLAPSLETREVVEWLNFYTGAPQVPAESAHFAFGRWAEIGPLTRFRQGEEEYPDRSATLVIERVALGREHRLTGPGIAEEARLTLPDLAAFQANSRLYPLGLDFIFTCGAEVAALPRSTRIEG